MFMHNMIYMICIDIEYGCQYSPASRRGRDKPGFSQGAANPLPFVILGFKCAHVATFCHTCFRESWLGGIVALLRRPRLSWPCLEAVNHTQVVVAGVDVIKALGWTDLLNDVGLLVADSGPVLRWPPLGSYHKYIYIYIYMYIHTQSNCKLQLL